MVGAGRFERPTPCAQGRCATRLRYAPTSQQLAGSDCGVQALEQECKTDGLNRSTFEAVQASPQLALLASAESWAAPVVRFRNREERDTSRRERELSRRCGNAG